MLKENKRLGAKKSKTGCLTCKSRKVKCTEERPKCLRCIKAGRECQGYSDIFVSTFSTNTRSQRDGTSSPEVLSRSVSRSLSPPFAPGESRAMHYYQSHVAPLLGGAVDTDFWMVSVMRLSQAETAIKQGIIAISHALEAEMLPEHSDRQQAYQRSTESYHKALSLTAHRVAAPEADAVALASCVLFLCLQCISRDRGEAVGLLRTGSAVMRKVLRGLHTGPLKQNELAEMFLPIFERLMILLRMFGEYSPHLRDPVWLFSVDYQARLQQLSGFREARSILHWLVFDTHHLLVNGRMQRMIDGVNFPSEADTEKCFDQQRGLLAAYAAWSQGFEALCARSQTELNKRQIAQLRLTFTISSLWAATSLASDESIHDLYTDQYKQALDQAEEVLEDTEPENFHFEQGVIPPLYFVILRCREPVLRQRAISLLQRAPRREGLWDRDEALRTASRVVDLESNPPQTVGAGIVFEDARICEVRTMFTDAQGTHAVFFSKRIGQEALTVWEECIPLEYGNYR